MITLLPFLRPRWNPLKLSGLSLWLDANEASSVLNSVGPDLAAGSGQTVRCWKDLSGNGRHLEQTTGSFQPTVQSNWKNGCRAVRFDGADDLLTGAIAPVPFANNAEFTILMACEFRASGGGPMTQGNNTAGLATNDTWVMFRSGSTTSCYVGHGSGISTSASYLSDTVAAVRAIRFNSTHLQLRRAGITDANSLKSGTDPQDVTSFTLGRWASFCNMDFAELLIYSRALSNSELVTAETYLRNKYGL